MSISEATRLREKDKLFLTDAELIRRLGVPKHIARPVIAEMEKKAGFPRKQKLWGDRRYWPAIEKWLERRSGMLDDGAARLIPEHREHRTRPPRPPTSLRHPAEGSHDE